MGYAEGSRYLDGPRLARWLSAAVERQEYVPPSLTRRLYEWRMGAQADIYILDRYLVELDLRPEEIPEECWMAARRRRRRAA